MNKHQESVELKAIGLVHTRERYRYEAPRQSVFASNEGWIELLPDYNFEAALEDLSGFERIWVIFKFHLNETWNPKVSPPVISPAGRKVGVFASRSPHRPNPIGMSCVELTGVEKRRIYIRNFDMLDGTPVFDIKPYIPAVDAFPGSAAGWVDETAKCTWQINYSPLFMEECNFIISQGGINLENFCRIQLAVEPLNSRRKRINIISDGVCDIACRTWRVRFEFDQHARQIQVLKIYSAYTAEELLPDAPDKYGDKPLHRLFNDKYSGW